MKKNIDKFGEELKKGEWLTVEALKELMGNNKEIKIKDKDAKSHEFKGNTKEFQDYLKRKYG